MKDKILITGGTGSLGHSLLELLSPKHTIIVFSRDEGKHAAMSNKVQSVVGDIRDINRLNEVFSKYRPTYVIHAGAFKRIDTMEFFPGECVKTNILGSENIATACLNYGVKKCILISTDKACKPINVYGATKFLAEKIFVNMDYNSDSTKFSVVRYGNVVGSRGSFIPMWKKQISKGHKVDITSKDCTRYLFSLEEATSLVCKCLFSSQGGEVFVPKLKSYKIMDIYNMICDKLGLSRDIYYQISGMRPGEKLHEDILSEHELPRTRESNILNVLTILPEVGNRTYRYDFYKGSCLNSFLNLSSPEDLEVYL